MSDPALVNFHDNVTNCRHDDVCENPDAVAVKWFKCSKCGRTRKEIVKSEVWG